ncbi:MAG: DUF2254 domain-containing protein [Firmicutes bacterium]|nr:DUF2254 domain-containing protein [Bacillota bacterium]
MLTKLKIWFFNQATWIYNIEYMIISIFILIGVMLVDLNITSIGKYLPDFMFTSAGLAKMILAPLAGALLTITTFTFSTILAVMIKYSSSYSSKTIENFIKQKSTMKVLGIFIGGFVYNICALVLMENVGDGDEVIAGFVGVAYAIVSIIYFTIFVQNVIVSMQTPNLIGRIYTETKQVIKREIASRKNAPVIKRSDRDKIVNIFSKKNGYLSTIDYKKLKKILKSVATLCVIDCKIGDYLNKRSQIAHIVLREGAEIDNLQQNISEVFIILENKLYFYDYRHGLTKLVEIALRAIAPVVNDPNTAIYAIRKISILLSYLARSEHIHTSKVEADDFEILYIENNLTEDLYFTFHQIVHYSKDDVSVMRALLEGLLLIEQSSTIKNRKFVDEYAKEIYTKSLPSHNNKMDVAYLEDVYRKFIHNKD